MDKKSFNTSISYIPKLTAKAWTVINGDTGEFVSSFHEHDRREIASITKVMTAYTSIQIINNLDINIMESMVETSFDASLMCGTTANLIEGDVLNIHDMLHAMMLPSGNDAAYALAEYFGLLLLELGFKGSDDPIRVFINEMNKNAKALGMTDTTYANPHGLENFYNKSSSADVAKLSVEAMKLPLLAQIVSKQKYGCIGQDILGRQKAFMWVNTNKLLSKGFCGLKTGITRAAGPCLVSCYKNNYINLIIVILASKNPETKWSDTVKLRDYALHYIMTKKEDATFEINQSPYGRINYTKNFDLT